MDWLNVGNKVKILDHTACEIREVVITDIRFRFEDGDLDIKCTYEYYGPIDTLGKIPQHRVCDIEIDKLYRMIEFAKKLDGVFETTPDLKKVLKGRRIARIEDYKVITMYNGSVCENCTCEYIDIRPDGTALCAQCSTIIAEGKK